MNTQSKKGLFLAEILLAVVIAAVIMGSGYLLYADIQKENNKNTFAQNLAALTIQLNQYYGEGKVVFSGRTGRTTDNATLVTSGTIPSTITTKPPSTITNIFGGSILIGPARSGTNLYFISNTLNAEQCSAVIQSVLKTQPIAFANKRGGFRASLRLRACINEDDGSGGLTALSKRDLVSSVCTGLPLVAVYSPTGEEWYGCKSL